MRSNPRPSIPPRGKLAKDPWQEKPGRPRHGESGGGTTDTVIDHAVHGVCSASAPPVHERFMYFPSTVGVVRTVKSSKLKAWELDPIR